MDMRDMRGMDGRNPYGSRGGYVTTRRPRRGRRGDRGMVYAEEDMRGRGMRDMARGGRGSRGRDYGDMRGNDYGYDMNRSPEMYYDARGGYDRNMDMGMDGHYGKRGGYEPVEFMGYCSGYYGSPDQDYGYDMRGRDYGDYGDDYGDYGETLSDEELEKWNKKLLAQLDEREKQMFSKEAIMQKIKVMNIPMEDYSEKELYTATLAMYTDHKQSIGQNPDLAIRLGKDFLTDKDSKVKGAERLAVYYDTFVD